jgi:uncharacterized membrane protein YkoI
MRRTLGWLLVALLSIGLFYGTFAWADEGEKEAKKAEITLDKAPKLVQETVLKEEKITEITMGDKKLYSVEWKDNGKDVKILVAADGKIIKKEKELSIADVPAPVKETLTKEAGENKFKEILEITVGDKTVYEAEWSDKGKDVEMVLTSDGKIANVTKQIGIDDVPKAVKETMLKEAGGNTIKDVEVITEGNKTIYEAEWMENGKEIDLKVSPDGKVITKKPGESEEKEKVKEEEKEKGKKEEKENEKEEEDD